MENKTSSFPFNSPLVVENLGCKTICPLKIILIGAITLGVAAGIVGIVAGAVVAIHSGQSTTTTTTTALSVNCSECSQQIFNLVMVIDGSGSVGPSNFNLVKQAAVQMVQQLNVAPQKVHVGVILYDDKVNTINTLAPNDQDKSTVITKIQNLAWPAGSTATGDALLQANQLFMNNLRLFVPNIVVLFTDGFTNFGSNATIAASIIKSNQIDIFAIGIGSSVNNNELNNIASDPDSVYKKNFANFNELLQDINEVVSTTCDTSAQIKLGDTANIESPQNELRRFKFDLSTLAANTDVQIQLTVNQGAIGLSYALDDILNTCASFITPTSQQTNPDGSITYFWNVSSDPSNSLLYISLRALNAGTNKYDLKMVQI